MLDERAEALEREDVEAYLQPLSEPARSVERPFAESALIAPIRSVDLILSNSAKASGTRTFRDARVDLVYLYEALPDDNTFRIPFLYDLRQARVDWRVQTSTLLEGTRPPAWVSGPIETAESEHFLALFRPGLTDPASTLQLAETARARLDEKVTFPLEGRHLILLAADRAQYEQMSGRQVPASAIAQAEATFEIASRGIRSEGRQILVNLGEFRGNSSAVETFQHELAHLALYPQTSPFTPSWVGEAAAMFLADTRPMQTWRVGLRQGRFDQMSFAELAGQPILGAHDPTGVAASFEYGYAAAAAHYLIDTFSAETFWNFYASYVEVPAPRVFDSVSGKSPSEQEEVLAGLASETTAVNLQEHFSLTESELDVRVREWIQAEVNASG
jgi:hypothetical protein